MRQRFAHSERPVNCDVRVSGNDKGSVLPNNAQMPIRERQKWFLREWRKHRGLSQEKLAERIGTTKSRISELETGSERYNQDVLEMLADALDCEPGDLLMRDPSMPDSSGGLFETIRRIPEPDMPRVRAVIEAMLPELPPKPTTSSQAAPARRKRA